MTEREPFVDSLHLCRFGGEDTKRRARARARESKRASERERRGVKERERERTHRRTCVDSDYMMPAFKVARVQIRKRLPPVCLHAPSIRAVATTSGGGAVVKTVVAAASASTRGRGTRAETAAAAASVSTNRC